MKSLSLIAAIFLALLFAYGFYDKAAEAKRVQELLDSEREEFRQYKAEHSARQLADRVTGAPSSPLQPDATAAEEEELRSVLDIMERQARGEYFLQSEIPPKRIEAAMMAAVSREALNLAPKYNALFSELGVSPEQSAFLQNHLSKIRLASFKVSQALGELQEAQKAYQKRAAELMDKEAYAKYAAFETSQPAQREVDAIKSTLEKRGKPLDPEAEAQMIALVKESGAHRRNSGGPFDEPPISIMGAERVLAYNETEVQRLREAFALLARRATKARLPEAAMNALSEHYADWLKQEEELRKRLEYLKSQGN